jgi:hypothetical protein
MNTLKLPLLSFSLVAALAAAGCGGGSDHQSMSMTTTPTSTTENFTEWSTVQVFTQPETGAPVNMDTLVFNFDGDDNPNAYAGLLPAT